MRMIHEDEDGASIRIWRREEGGGGGRREEDEEDGASIRIWMTMRKRMLDDKDEDA